MWKNSLHFVRCLIRPLSHPLCIENRRLISQSSQLKKQFFERDRRGFEYRVDRDIDWNMHVARGSKMFVNECKMFWEEVKDYFRSDPKVYSDGDTDVFYRFDSEVIITYFNGTASICETLVNS